MMKDTEGLIKEQLKQGNEEAYRHLYKHHYVFLCHVANGYVGDRDLAESLVGDVIYHLWEVHETLDIRSSLRGYLTRAVRNRCMDYLSSKYERNEVVFSALGADEAVKDHSFLSDSHPLGTLLERELEEEIFRAIESLPEECRRVFLKSRFEEKKYEEISQELGISVNTVKYHIKNALSILYKKLEGYLLCLFLLLLH